LRRFRPRVIPLYQRQPFKVDKLPSAGTKLTEAETLRVIRAPDLHNASITL